MAQPEIGNPDPQWQVDPAVVGLPTALFRWISSAGSTNGFPNTLGAASGHANQVGSALYGTSQGVAPGVALVENYEAVYFVGLIQAGVPIAPSLVSQSFAFGGQNDTIDRNYDDYVNVHGTLFASGVGNGGAPASPATMWNGIGVGAYGGSSSVGPTADGRCKPDLTAPAGLTSFATPQVIGTAALMLEAVTNGVVPPSQAGSATDWRTLKALLINGADKPLNWTNAVTLPLDARYGSGVLNVLRCYEQLRGGQLTAAATNRYGLSDPALPPAMNGGAVVRRGWNLATISHGPIESAAHHYLFDSSAVNLPHDTLDVTLTWALPLGGAAANNLDLRLFDAEAGTLIAESRSSRNNVEHVHVKNLPAGRYVVQVLKPGGVVESVSRSETYALAFDFVSALTAGPRWVAPRREGGNFRARLEGEPAQSYLVERSQDCEDWSEVLTHPMSGNGYVDFQDALGGSGSGWVYRARRVP